MSQFTPTPQQAQILSSFQEGKNLIIDARAGCGKTSTLTLLANSTSSPGIVVAFNRKIRDELKEKLPPHFEAVTFNQMGLRAWSNGRRGVRTDAGKARKVIDETLLAANLSLSWKEKQDLIRLLDSVRTLGLVPNKSHGWNPNLTASGLIPDTPSSWSQIYSWAEVEEKEETHIFLLKFLHKSIEGAFRGWIDFTDQIYMPTCFGASFPKTSILMADEVQDASPLNHKMLRLTQATQKILVGDPLQSIYAFRGAMTDSMNQLDKVFNNEREVIRLPLSTTFRCGKRIVKRAQSYVPDFTAHTTNPEGEIQTWKSEWSLSSIPDGAAVLCRNNAPLLTLALKLLAKKRKVTILGKEFAENLKRDLLKACPEDLPIASLPPLITAFYNSKLKTSPTVAQLSLVDDRTSAIAALTEDLPPTATRNTLINTLDSLFEDREDNKGILLSTGHKAKGLEWDWVLHLNPELIPSTWALKSGDEEELKQEFNLRYVIETRPKSTLVLASLSDLEP